MKCGLLYLSQESCLVGDVSYHSYEGLVVEGGERDRIAKDLGVHNKVMMLRNHGAVCCGESIEEAFYYAYHLVSKYICYKTRSILCNLCFSLQTRRILALNPIWLLFFRCWPLMPS